VRQLRQTLESVYLEHRALLWITAAYLLGGGVALAWLDRPWPIRLTNGGMPVVWAIASLIWLLFQYLRHPRHARAILTRERVLGAILVMLLIEPVQITFQALKQAIGHVVGFPWDPWLHEADLLLHRTEPWRMYARVLPDWSWIRAIDVLYVTWLLLFLLFLFWASWSHRRLLRQQALIAFLLLTTIGATLGAWTGASAGPCYYSFVTPHSSPGPYDELLLRLDSFGSNGTGLIARQAQNWLWGVHVDDQTANYSGVSAMPSLHVGMAVLFALVAWERYMPLGIVMTAYAAMIQLGSVLLGWHYAVDGYVGALLAVACWMGARQVLRFSLVTRDSPVDVPGYGSSAHGL
jgi:hypothetical protein